MEDAARKGTPGGGEPRSGEHADDDADDRVRDLPLGVTEDREPLARDGQGQQVRVPGQGVGQDGVFLARPLFGRAYELSVGFQF